MDMFCIFTHSKNPEMTRKMCLIKFASIEEAIKALVHMHNHHYKESYLRVSFARSDS